MNAAPGPSALHPAAAAALVMAIGMGFGRFAFTAIYPHMLDEGLLSLAEGGWAASVNYAGYLLGALLGMRASAASAHRLCLWSMLGTAFCLAILAIVTSPLLLIFVRGIAGVFSALAMIAASLWLLEQRQQAHSAPLLFAGVGIGIAVSAELLAPQTMCKPLPRALSNTCCSWTSAARTSGQLASRPLKRGAWERSGS